MRSAMDMAGFVTRMEHPIGSVAVKPDRRAGWLVVGAMTLVITVVASPFSAGDDAFSSCQHVQGSDGRTTELPCSEATDDNAGSLSHRNTP